MDLKIALLLLAINSIVIFPSYGQTPNFQGKTMTIVVGTVAGDLYDLYARAIPHLAQERLNA